MKKIFFLLSCFLISSCQTNCFDNFYNDEQIDTNLYIPRQRNENIKVIDTIDLINTLKRYEKDYIILGSSSFNGQWCARSLAVEVAKDKGASLIIIGIKQSDKNTNTVAIKILQANNIYHSGKFSGNISTTPLSGSYSGVSTYYTTNTFYKQYQNYYFDQIAFFLAPKRR